MPRALDLAKRSVNSVWCTASPARHRSRPKQTVS